MVSFGIFLLKQYLFAVRWHNSGFSRLLGDDMLDILVPGLEWGLLALSFVLFFNFQYLSGLPSCAFFDIARFDILNEILKVPFADYRTLHPPWDVVCRPRQTKDDVHILVAIFQ